MIRTDTQLVTLDPIVGIGSKYGGKSVNARDLTQFDALFLLPSGSGALDEGSADRERSVHRGRVVIDSAPALGR